MNLGEEFSGLSLKETLYFIHATKYKILIISYVLKKHSSLTIENNPSFSAYFTMIMIIGR